MKRVFILVTILTLSVLPLFGQSYSAQQQVVKTTSGTGATLRLIGTGAIYDLLSWNVSGGTLSLCSMTVDSSTDNITWSSGGVFTTQDCSVNGTATPVTTLPVNYIRINISTFTVLTGTPTVTVLFTGYAGNPFIGGGGVGSWSGLTSPTGNLALTMGANTSAWTFNAATGSGVTLMDILDTASNSGTGYLLRVHTAASSLAKAVGFFALGTTNGVELTGAGVLQAVNSGHVNADQCSGATCGTVTTTGTMTTSALVASNGTTIIKTPSATATLDSSGNVSTPGTVSTGVGGSVGGGIAATEGTATSAASGQDICYADSTAHDFKCSLNNGSYFPLVSTVTSPLTVGTGGILSFGNQTAYTTLGNNTNSSAAPAFNVESGVNAQTGSGYTVLTTDFKKIVSVSNASAQTVNLPSTAPAAGWYVDIENTGAGLWTVGRNGLTIDGGTISPVLNQNQGLRVYSDGANYFTERGISSSTILFANVNNGLGSGLTDYVAFGGGNFRTAENQTQTYMPYACTLRNMTITTSTSQPASNSLTFNLRKNGANCNIQIVIAGGSAAGSFTDLTNTCPVVQSDLVNLQSIEQTGTSATVQMVALQCGQ